jgi:amidohydrolase
MNYSARAARLGRELGEAAAAAPPVASPHAGAPAEIVGRLEKAVESVTSELLDLSHDVHSHPELCFEEHHAAEAVARLVGRHGIEVETGAYGLATALRARVGEGRPRLAVLAEYDALPGIGHACGHNVICAAGVGAFLALADVVGDLDGSVELIGTPAEEGGGGKELILQAGGFDDVDAAIMVHPSGIDICDRPLIGVRQVTATYRGLAAHASAMPWHGRNAVDAVVTAYNGVNTLRQHILPSDRLHGVITDGGQKPNIVPDRASTLFYVRSLDPDSLDELCERVDAVLRGAAAMTGTVVDIDWDVAPTYLPLRNNTTLSARYGVRVSARGRRVLPGDALPADAAASTDMGNISQYVPSIHPFVAVSPPTVVPHTPDFTGWAGGEHGDRAVVDAAVGLAATAADFLTDAGLRDAVAAEFAASGGRTHQRA